MAAPSRWRSAEDAAAGRKGERGGPGGPNARLIGPNAILQFAAVLERQEGAERTAALLADAGLAGLPDGEHMIPEGDAARLHRRLRAEFPARAPDLARAAGFATGDYILAHRIPKVAQTVLRLLPAPLAARALSAAIARHAWTFAGSGRFRVVDPWTFEIADNPLVRGERSPAPLCHWHAAVFERLYARLVHPDVRCVETRCSAQPGCDTCRFEVLRRWQAD